MSKKGKYPSSLFFVGCLINFFRNCLLNLVMIALFILGIKFRFCLYAALLLLCLNLVMAFITQLRIKRTIYKMQNAASDENGKDATKFSDIVLDPNWVKNVTDYTEEKINEYNILNEPSQRNEEDSSNDEKEEK